eukprot:SAG25_NODE_709_length_5824_cov_4.561048_3_plen_87_part_00
MLFKDFAVILSVSPEFSGFSYTAYMAHGPRPYLVRAAKNRGADPGIEYGLAVARGPPAPAAPTPCCSILFHIEDVRHWYQDPSRVS